MQYLFYGIGFGFRTPTREGVELGAESRHLLQKVFPKTITIAAVARISEDLLEGAARLEPSRAEVKRLSSEQLTKLTESASPDSITSKTPYVGVYVEKF